MAQDTHLFSVSKPRQTLGALHNNHSAIPQPSSALKRSSSVSGFRGQHLDAPATVQHSRSQSSSRMSMMPSRPPPQPNFARMSMGPTTGDFGQGARGGARMSMAPRSSNPLTTPHHNQNTVALSAQRTSSAWVGRQSMGPSVNHQQSFFVQAPLPPGVPNDPRRVRDRQVQTRMISELEQYVAENNFAVDMKHQLHPNAFRQPTQRDFNMIFQWLYKRIDPAYVFQKSIDNETPALLQQLRYPFAKSITKSQLSAVGGSNWHNLLGMLHWLMQLARMMDGFVTAQYDYALETAGVDVSADRIMASFLDRAYHTWSSCPEEEVDVLLSQEVDLMARQFEENRAGYMADLELLEAENASLLKQIEEEKAAMPDLQVLDDDKKLLEEDSDKFEAYAKKMTERLTKTEEKIRLLKDELIKCDAQIEEAMQDKADLQEAVDRQGITIQQIDQMNGERERLQDSAEDVKQRLEDVMTNIKEKEHEASTNLAHLEALTREYNSLCYSVGIRDEEFELTIQVNDGSDFSSSQLGASRGGGDRLLADSETGYHPSRILNRDMRGTIKAYITSVRRDVDKRRTELKSKDDKNRGLLIDIVDAMDQKRHEVDALQHRELNAQDEYNKTKDATTKQKFDSDAEIEKTEGELSRMRSTLNEDIQLWKQRELNAQIEYEQLSMDANSLRESLHTEAQGMLEFIINFKMHIQESLEGYEGFVEEEAEREYAFEEELDKKARQERSRADAMEIEEKIEEEEEEL